VKRRGVYEATVEELLRRSIVDSDSTAVDVLIARLSGISAVKEFLTRKGISGMRIERNERQLQTESLGLSWEDRYTDPDVFEAAARALTTEQRDSAWNAHLRDPRDKATPLAMAEFLKSLESGRLLSAASTTTLLAIMDATATGQDRLRAGVPAGWKVAHKTGTGRSWKGVTETTNDAGILTSPDGARISIAVFVAGSSAPDQEQAAIIARVAKLVANASQSAKAP
jgi:beta-lactamase class A